MKSTEKIEGTFSVPYFITIKLMILKEKIEKLAADFLEGTDKFIMNMKVSPTNLIVVTLDGDTMVTIDDCINMSRAIEHNLDREEEDFELRVTSYGADKPLIDPRQYKKHLGRELDITKTDETKVQGKLLEFTDKDILISKAKSKKKNQEDDTECRIMFDDIEEVKIILSFK